MRVYLIGYMYCGKSTLGKRLARLMGYEFVDLDVKFEERYHTTIPIFFEKYGEGAFRKLETLMLESTSEMDNVVVATGGGTPCQGNNMRRIKELGVSVYLELSFDAICSRMVNSHKVRPVLANKTIEERREFIKKQLDERNLFYHQADITFDAFGNDAGNIGVKLYNAIQEYIANKDDK